MSRFSVEDTIKQLTDWLLSDARRINDTGSLDTAIVDRLRQAGLPIARYTTGVPSLHPQVDSFSTLWEEEKGLSFRQYRVDGTEGADLSTSPIFLAYETGEPQRYRLDVPPRQNEYVLLAELRSAGYTDYLVLSLPFSDGSHKAMSFATRQPGGFEAEHVDVLEGLAYPLAATIEVRYLRHLAGVLMDTYVGPVAGRRVLDGAIRRGMGETFRAVIWFCDLKGFTQLSESLSAQHLIDTLNDYFDVMTTAIEANGGEILKFVGDAVLAIFQPSQHGDTELAAAQALQAALSATAQLRTVNHRRAGAGHPVIACGIALHVGEVTYGNVGGMNRLDFTVIGPAVNLASRIESLTRQLQRPILVSSEFAALAAAEFEELGRFDLKGVNETQVVFAPRS